MTVRLMRDIGDTVIPLLPNDSPWRDLEAAGSVTMNVNNSRSHSVCGKNCTHSPALLFHNTVYACMPTELFWSISRFPLSESYHQGKVQDPRP